MRYRQKPIWQSLIAFTLALYAGSLISRSSYLEATRPEYKDPGVIHEGARRSDIIATLGNPAQSFKEGEQDVDIFKFDPNGRDRGTKVAVGTFNATADILTGVFGRW